MAATRPSNRGLDEGGLRIVLGSSGGEDGGGGGSGDGYSELRGPQETEVRHPSNIPTHPIPAFQHAFAESLEEVTTANGVHKPKLRGLDARARRDLLLSQGRQDEPFDVKWRYRPGQSQHEIIKLLAQISFGVYLMLTGMANSTAQVITILQGHIDEVDEFLEVALEDQDQAVEDLKKRINHLKLPMANMEVFETLLADRKFRNEILDGNEKIDAILDRTNAAVKQWDDDIESGLRSSAIFAKWLQDQDSGDWHADHPELVDVFDAMKGNTDGWISAFQDMNNRAQDINDLIVTLMNIVTEMEAKAGEVSRRTSSSIQPFSSVPNTAIQPNFPRSSASAATMFSPTGASLFSPTETYLLQPTQYTPPTYLEPKQYTPPTTTFIQNPFGDESNYDFDDDDDSLYPLPGILPLLPPTRSTNRQHAASAFPSPVIKEPERVREQPQSQLPIEVKSEPEPKPAAEPEPKIEPKQEHKSEIDTTPESKAEAEVESVPVVQEPASGSAPAPTPVSTPVSTPVPVPSPIEPVQVSQIEPKQPMVDQETKSEADVAEPKPESAPAPAPAPAQAQAQAQTQSPRPELEQEQEQQQKQEQQGLDFGVVVEDDYSDSDDDASSIGDQLDVPLEQAAIDRASKASVASLYLLQPMTYTPPTVTPKTTTPKVVTPKVVTPKVATPKVATPERSPIAAKSAGKALTPTTASSSTATTPTVLTPTLITPTTATIATATTGTATKVIAIKGQVAKTVTTKAVPTKIVVTKVAAAPKDSDKMMKLAPATVTVIPTTTASSPTTSMSTSSTRSSDTTPIIVSTAATATVSTPSMATSTKFVTPKIVQTATAVVMTPPMQRAHSPTSEDERLGVGMEQSLSLRQRLSKTPDAIRIPPRSVPQSPMNLPSPNYATPRTATSVQFDSPYGSDGDSHFLQRHAAAGSPAELSPPPMQTLVPSPRSEHQQYYRQVQASPHSPLQQRPSTAISGHHHTALTERPVMYRNQPSQLGAMGGTMGNNNTVGMGAEYGDGIMSPRADSRGSDRQLKKKKSAFGWFKKAFTMDEDERAAFESRRGMQQPQDQYYNNNNSPRFLDGKRLR